MNSKVNLRKQLEVGVSMFLQQGKSITKVMPKGAKRRPTQPKEKTIEIEIDYLPLALRTKHFGS